MDVAVEFFINLAARQWYTTPSSYPVADVPFGTEAGCEEGHFHELDFGWWSVLWAWVCCWVARRSFVGHGAS